MKKIPMLFSRPTIHGIQCGDKTMTRRVVKLPPWLQRCGGDLFDARPDLIWGVTPGLHVHCYADGEEFWNRLRNPWGFPGPDGVALYARETWNTSARWRETKPSELPTGIDVFYAADYPEDQLKELGPWRPAIFLPHKFSRITLPLVNVKAERLQDISEADARAEGIEFTDGLWKDYSGRTTGFCDPRKSFETLWDSINGKKHPWRNNDWVWVPEWEPYKPPTP